MSVRVNNSSEGLPLERTLMLSFHLLYSGMRYLSVKCSLNAFQSAQVHNQIHQIHVRKDSIDALCQKEGQSH